MKKFWSVLLSISLLLLPLSMGACDKNPPTTPPADTKVSVESLVDNLAVGVTIYNYVTSFVVPFLPADVRDKLCPIFGKIKIYWNLGMKELGAVIDNKGAVGTSEITINLGHLNEAIDELFTSGLLDEKYRVYFTGIQAVVKLACATMLPKVKFEDAAVVELSGLYITFDCASGPTTMSVKKVTAEDVRAAVAKLKEIPPEVSAVLDVIK